MNKFDKDFLSEKVKYLAGVDEAGRGPLAGPVVAAAVVFSPYVKIKGVDDSKVLTESTRERLYEKITSKALSYAVSIVDVEKIEEINILNASLLAMKQAVNQLSVKPDLILVDGNRKFKYDVDVIPIVKGDAKSFSIGAASILAKVTRDRLMEKFALDYPGYLWEKNKGYPTKQHRNCIKIYGATPLHRQSFLKKLYSEMNQLELLEADD